MTQPSTNTVPATSIHPGHGSRVGALGRFVLTLGLVLATLGIWQAAWASTPGTHCGQPVHHDNEVHFDDSPVCLSFHTEYSSGRFYNDCDDELLLFVGSEPELNNEDRAIKVPPQTEADIFLNPGVNEFHWRLPDGRSGVIEIENFEPTFSFCDGIGCDTMATDGQPVLSVLLILAVSLLIRRRWQRTVA